MLKLITAAIFSLPLLVSARAPGNYSQVKTEILKTSQTDLIRTLNEFVKAGAPSRMIGMPGHDKAKNYLLDFIKSSDPKGSGKLIVDNFTPDVGEAKRFYQNDFDQKVEGKISKIHPDYQKWLRFTTYMKGTADRLAPNQGTNIIWEKTGIDASKLFVILVHYDTVVHDPNTLMINEKSAMPGANYNASGVSVALSILKTLAQIDLNYSVHVAFVDWQAVGFLGSYRYAQELKKSGKNVIGFVNLEMLGQDTSFLDKTKKTGNMNVYYRLEDEKFISFLNQHGTKMTSKVSFGQKPTGFENSDNFRMWEQGYSGGTYTQNWEDDFNPKFYQTSQDTPETLNHQTLYYGYQFIGGAVVSTLLDITK